jgi:type I restriction enzyme R subunit
LRDYTRKAVRKEFSTLNVFLQKWTGAAQKLAIIAELQEHGVMLDELADEVGKDLDPFDLICHVAFDQPPLTRQERANNVKKRNYFAKYGEQARTILNALLDKYADAGIDSIEDLGILRVLPFSKFGTPIEIIKLFGGKDEFLAALQELEAALYAVA